MFTSSYRLPMARRITLASLTVILAIAVAIGTVRDGAGVATAAPSKPTSATSQTTQPKECVGSHFATLGAIYDAVFDSFLPQLPKSVRDQAPTLKKRAHRDMATMKISTLWVSNHPYQMGADEKSPIMTYRDPISQYIVTQLVNAREGKSTGAITVENLTLAQAVETVWLYLYVTVLVPLTIARRSMPPIGPLWGPFKIGTLITMPILIGVLATTQFYKTISAKLVDACVVSVTKAEKENAGKPVKDLRFTDGVPALVDDVAKQVMMADPDRCPSIGSLPLSRIVTRTSNYLRYLNKNPALDGEIVRLTKQLQTAMKRQRVPHNMIPADPADFNTAETILSNMLSIAPYVGGAPTDIGIGLTHNFHEGADFSKTMALSDLPVTKSLTAAYYAYAISTHMLVVAWDNAGVDPAAQLLNQMVPGLGLTGDMMPRSFGLISAPNVYGLVVFHNVVRSMCLTEDYKPRAADDKSASKVKRKPFRRF